jgi:hypothetical protein
VQQSPECKPFVFNQTAVIAPTTQFPSKKASTKTTAQLFKKQRLRLNPTYAPELPTNNTNTHNPRDQSMYDDDNDDVSLPPENDDYESGSALMDEHSIASEESFGSEVSFGNHGVADTTESPPVESDYSCFSTSQQCVTSLMYLLDEMECPDYGFKVIMDWARNCFEVGFDFNPKCKTRSGNLQWMYDALHNAEQMLPHLELIELPDPLPNVKNMNVICYDFVPQLLSILQNQTMMSGKNLVLDPNNPLAMYRPHDGRLGEALSGSVYRDMYRRLVSNPSRQLLCPLICYTDGTQVDSLSRFGVEPFLFTPAVLSHAARCKAEAWRPLGYVQQLKSNLQSDQRKLSSSAKARNYHAQLQAMLKSLQRVQTGADSRLQNVEIYLFGKCVQVDVLCPILLIAADTALQLTNSVDIIQVTQRECSM